LLFDRTPAINISSNVAEEKKAGYKKALNCEGRSPGAQYAATVYTFGAQGQRTRSTLT